MLRRILDDTRRALVRELEGQLAELRVTLVRAGAPDEEQKALARSIAQLDEMFLLVVVGEFNAGKSAVINALLGERVLEEGVTPTTSRIELLRHGGDRRRTPRGGDFEEITLPLKILREMNIVDTPGTNAVIEGHEALTRDFVPRSDLVLFVTSADRPFTASERAFLEAIRSWGKKVVVAVNKVDILEKAEDLTKVVEFVRERMRALLGLRPEVFAVSARRAQKMKAAGVAPDPRTTGFGALEAYVTKTLDDAGRFRLKLENPLGVAQRVLERAEVASKDALARLDEDVALVREVEGQIALGREELQKDFRTRLPDMEKLLLELEARGLGFLERRLRLGGLPGLVSRGGTRAAYEREVVGGLVPAVEKRVEGIVDALVAAEVGRGKTLAERLAARRRVHGERLPAVAFQDAAAERTRVLQTFRREIERGLETRDLRNEASRFSGAARGAAVATMLLLALAAVVGAVALTAASSSTHRALGLVAAGILGVTASLLLPAWRRLEQRRLTDRTAGQRQKLVGTLRAAFERELEHSRKRLLDARAPYEEWVRSEGERLRAEQAKLAELRRGFESLRARVAAPS
jgi:small GTP-binding protein